MKMVEPIARDDSIWQGHPDVAYLDGLVFIVWRESDKHLNDGGTRIKIKWGKITDQDMPYTNEAVIAESTHRLNCPRISVIDDRLYVVCDEIQAGSNYIQAENDPSKTHVIMWISESITGLAITWEGPIHTNIHGIVPDRVMVFKSQKIISTHTKMKFDYGERAATAKDLFDASTFEGGYIRESLDGYLSTKVWTQEKDEHPRDYWLGSRLANDPKLNLCESSIMSHGSDVLFCLMRENSGDGLPAYFCTSHDAKVWSEPKFTPLFGCHRPTWGFLKSGNILVTYREQSSIMSKRCWARNTFAALIPVAGQANIANTIEEEAIILSLDHDRSVKPDGGYTGWVQLPDERIFVVNYITDDAPKPYIRGYVLRESDFVFGETK